jgi:hypothetical protein
VLRVGAGRQVDQSFIRSIYAGGQVRFGPGARGLAGLSFRDERWRIRWSVRRGNRSRHT